MFNVDTFNVGEFNVDTFNVDVFNVDTFNVSVFNVDTFNVDMLIVDTVTADVSKLHPTSCHVYRSQFHTSIIKNITLTNINQSGTDKIVLK